MQRRAEVFSHPSRWNGHTLRKKGEGGDSIHTASFAFSKVEFAVSKLRTSEV